MANNFLPKYYKESNRDQIEEIMIHASRNPFKGFKQLIKNYSWSRLFLYALADHMAMKEGTELRLSTGVVESEPLTAYMFYMNEQYIGTMKEYGVGGPTWISIFYTDMEAVSLKPMTVSDIIITYNDPINGVPVSVGVAVTYQIENTVKAKIAVKNYRNDLVSRTKAMLFDECSSGADLRNNDSNWLAYKLQHKVDDIGLKILKLEITEKADHILRVN